MEHFPKSAPRKYAHITMTRDAYEKCAEAVLMGFDGEQGTALGAVHLEILAESVDARAYDYEAALRYLVGRASDLRYAVRDRVREAVEEATRLAVARAVRESCPPKASSEVA